MFKEQNKVRAGGSSAGQKSRNRKNQMKIIAGLGNPGREYENTKHNVGFLTIDILAEKYGIKVNKIKFKGLGHRLA